jgi:hypothetical protein
MRREDPRTVTADRGALAAAGGGDDSLVDRQRRLGIGISDGHGGPRLSSEAQKASDSNSDYDPRVGQTQRDDLRLP